MSECCPTKYESTCVLLTVRNVGNNRIMVNSTHATCTSFNLRGINHQLEFQEIYFYFFVYVLYSNPIKHFGQKKMFNETLDIFKHFHSRKYSIGDDEISCEIPKIPPSMWWLLVVCSYLLLGSIIIAKPR